MQNLYKVYIVVLSVVINIEVAYTQDVSICTFTNTTGSMPPPDLAPSYSMTIEWKNFDTDSTMIVNEYFNSIQNIGSQDVYSEQFYAKVIIDRKESQLLQYTKGEGCTVQDLSSFTYYKDKAWVTAFNEFYGIITHSIPVFVEKTTIRNITVNHWETCLYILESQLTLKVDFYFSFKWNMEYVSSLNDFIPVRFELLGSMPSGPNSVTKRRFHVIGDIVNFNPTPDLNELQTHMQLPAGVYCTGKKSSFPLNPLPKEFSILFEIVDNDKHTITYEHIWYNNIKKVIRRDYKKADNTDPDATLEIFDFNLGIHYMMDPTAGSCSNAEELGIGNRYVKPNGNGTIRMISAGEFFHVKNTKVQYVGYRSTRGILSDVWVGTYLDPDTNTNTTIEWYFSKKYSEAVGGTIAYSSLTRMDIWELGATKPVVRNVLQMDSETPPLDMFSVGLCYKTQRIRVLIHFQVINGSLSVVSDQYLRDTLLEKLTSLAFIPPLRMTDVILSQIGDSDLYFDGSLLEKAPYENAKIVPKPKKQHALETAYRFLHGSLLSIPIITIANFTNSRLVLKALETRRLDYIAEFSTPPTIPTTPFRTPPTPDITPPTIKPETPTTFHTPEVPPFLRSSTSAKPMPVTKCTCPPVTCPPLPITKCPPSTPCPKQTCPHAVLTTPKCPTPAPPCVQTQCPPNTSGSTCPPPTPCPKVSCPSPKPCSQKACPQTTCPSCKPCTTQSTVTCPTTSVTSTTRSSTTNQNSNTLKQTGDGNSGSGVSSGGAAGLAIGMILIGMIIGIVLLRVFQKVTKHRNPDERNFFTKYLSDEENY